MARHTVGGQCVVRSSPILALLVALTALDCSGRSLSRSARRAGAAGDAAVGGTHGDGGSSGGDATGGSSGTSAGASTCSEEVSGSVRWAREFETSGGGARVAGIGRCGDGLCIGGDFQGELRFQSNLVAVATDEAYAAKLTTEGEPIWIQRLGGYAPSDRFVVTSFAADPRGGVAMAGTFEGELMLPTDDNAMTTLESAGGSYEAIVVRLRDDGAVAWYDRFGAMTEFPSGTALAFDATGGLIVAGPARSSNERELVLRAYEADGSERFARTALGGGMPMALGLDAEGDIFLLSYFPRTVVFPDSGTGSELSASGAGFCVVAFDPVGLFRWSQCPDGDSQAILPFEMAVDDRGNLAIAGGFIGRIGFAPRPLDPGPLEFLSSQNDDDEDVVVAKLDSSGALLWQKQFGAAGDQTATLGLALASDGAVVLAGDAWGTFDFGDESAPIGSDSASAFLAELDAEGRHVWSRLLGPYAYTSGHSGLFLDSSRSCDTSFFATDYEGMFDAEPGSDPDSVYGILVGEFFR